MSFSVSSFPRTWWLLNRPLGKHFAFCGDCSMVPAQLFFFFFKQDAWVLCPSEPQNWPYPRLIPSVDWKTSSFFFFFPA